MSGRQVIAFSGGKDSTAMAIRLDELGEDFTLLMTPTGNELPELWVHIARLLRRLDRPVVFPRGPSLAALIEGFKAVPNHRQRWCTRMIKIQPCIAWLVQHPGSVLCVGLRADEEARVGLYGDWATYRYPLREWGWGLDEVWGYLDSVGQEVPARTDCAVCYGQRIGEWYVLWRDHPDLFAQGERWEELAGGHTFRSGERDTWPAALKDLRAEFERGRKPREFRNKNLPLFGRKAERNVCRVCSL